MTFKEVVPNIFSWSVLSEEKGYDFNGWFVLTSGGNFLIDPPQASEEIWFEMEKRGKPKGIYLTNKHHTRKAADFKEKYAAPIWISSADLPLMEIPVDRTYKNGETLPGGFKVIQISDSKTPGESALYLNWNRGILIVGDAVIGNPPGKLDLLPPPKIKDPIQAKKGLEVLLQYNFETLLVGDGTSILKAGKKALAEFL